MSEEPNDKANRAAEDINLGLNTLFGALGDAIGDMVSRLEDGKGGTISRDHEIQTPKGPIRAHAGVRLRMGGMNVGETVKPEAAKPVNPNRNAPQDAKPPAAKSLSYDIFEEDDGWVLSADLPGVQREEFTLKRHESSLHLSTSGTRRYEAEVNLERPFDLDGIEVRLHNGVLSLQIPKGEE